MNRVGEVAASVAACSESLGEDGIFQIKQHKLTAVKELKRAGEGAIYNSSSASYNSTRSRGRWTGNRYSIAKKD